jgi:hypothetical protein
MMKNKSFVAFILTHGRPDKVKTFHSLNKCGYTGDVIILVDDQDGTVEQYKEIYGDRVHVFNKNEIAKTFDTADNFNDMRAICYARNACFEIAEELGYKYFIQLDDDYTDFRYKFNHKFEYGDWYIRNLDKVFDLLLDYFKTIPAKSIAMAQGGDFIGGQNSGLAKSIKIKRKAMNTFICSTDRKFQFIGRVNEDVNTYTALARAGDLFFTLPNIAINQLQTQSNSGGMTELYLNAGTYVKSFYSIMFAPSCVKISMMGSKFKRLHHKVSWNNAVPVIIREDLKKK